MEPIESSITDSATQQDRDTEAKILRAVAKAGAYCIGFTADMVLFQQPTETLSVPLSTFTNPDEAVAAIKTRLALAGFDGGAQ
jgi:hypothetical protein